MDDGEDMDILAADLIDNTVAVDEVLANQIIRKLGDDSSHHWLCQQQFAQIEYFSDATRDAWIVESRAM